MHPILADRRRLQLYLAGWVFVGGILGLTLHLGLGAPSRESLLFGLPMGLLAAPMSLSAWYVGRALPLSRTPGIRVLAAAFGAAVTISGIWAFVGQWWWQALGSLGWATSDVTRGQLVVPLIV